METRTRANCGEMRSKGTVHMTKKSTEELQRQLELHLNTISTQQQALVITIEVLVGEAVGVETSKPGSSGVS